MKKILALVLAAIFFSGCGSAFLVNEELSPGSRTMKTLEVFQVLANENHFSKCLAKDSDWRVFCIVSAPIDEKPKMFYDDLTLSGDFTIVGTYTYNTKDSRKTVPVLFYTKDCKKYSEEDLHFIISLFCD